MDNSIFVVLDVIVRILMFSACLLAAWVFGYYYRDEEIERSRRKNRKRRNKLHY